MILVLIATISPLPTYKKHFDERPAPSFSHNKRAFYSKV
nr:MAG TPA: hypothetical protein [Caudoviricetes sp.]